MQTSTGSSPRHRPTGLAVFAVVNAVGLIVTVALWAIPYLWVNRGLFGISGPEKP